MISAREAVIDVLAEQARCFAEMPPMSPPLEQLDDREARLALAIHRTVLQRWITLEYLIEMSLSKPVEELEPRMQAVLLSGAAQILFMERLPSHAVVNESVELAKRLIRPGAAGMVNAVLRRTAELVVERLPDDPGEPWAPARDRLPWEGGSLRLARPLLPPMSDLDEHLAVATSHPPPLIAAWRKQFGDAEAVRCLVHSLKTAPLIVRAEPEFDAADEAELVEPHEQQGFHVWRGSRSQLLKWMAQSPHRWVQDPTAAKPVTFTATTPVKTAIDLCAGRGTKSRQLAVTHRNASVIATDPEAQRFGDLRAVAELYPRIRAIDFHRIHDHDGQADLVLLDVPCSNTGVLARRLEARYRYGEESLASVTQLQRRIIDNAAALLRRDRGRITGMLLYSTCSIEPRENREQAQWAAERLGLNIQHEELALPGGDGPTYHDGGYFAVLTPGGA